MREYIVLCNHDHYNHCGIVRTLGEAGIRPIVIAVHNDPPMATVSKYTKKKHIVSSPEEGIKLILSEYAKSKTEKSFILTGDDVSVMALDSHYDELKDYFYFYNAGETGRIKHFMSKDILCELAAKHGFNVAKTWKVKPGEIPEDIEYPIITKAINSYSAEWKGIVSICHNEDELKAAYKNIKSEYIILQQLINKVDEVSFDGIAINHGKDFIMIQECRQEYAIEGNYSPYWNVRNSHNGDFNKKASGMLEEIGLEGIFEFEFMVDKDGQLWFLEINFRNTVLGWVTTVEGMPQVMLWCGAIEKGRFSDNWYREIPADFKAVAECFDYDARVKKGIISKKEWKKQYKSAQAKLYLGRKDFIPFLSFMWYKLTKMNRQ